MEQDELSHYLDRELSVERWATLGVLVFIIIQIAVMSYLIKDLDELSVYLVLIGIQAMCYVGTVARVMSFLRRATGN